MMASCIDWSWVANLLPKIPIQDFTRSYDLESNPTTVPPESEFLSHPNCLFFQIVRSYNPTLNFKFFSFYYFTSIYLKSYSPWSSPFTCLIFFYIVISKKKIPNINSLMSTKYMLLN